MIKERVVVTVYRDTFITKCKFWFYNRGEKQHVSFGFPNSTEYVDEATGKLRNFTTQIDGKRIETNKVTQKTDYTDVGNTIDWYSWSYDLQSKDTLIVENRYTGEVGFSPNSMTVKYIIGTGSTWEGTIGKGEIIFDISNIASSDFVIKGNYAKTDLKPNIYTDSLVFSFNDYKPKWNENLSVELVPFWRGMYTSGMSDLFPGKELNAQKIRLMRNEIIARHGYIFKDKTLNEYFRQQSWYMPNKNYNQKMLNKYEKSFMDNLLNIEQEIK